jgi:type IV pilus assembly protein PilE
MIAVAVVAILATIAYPSYERYVTSSWRAKAAGCLTELAQGMERRFTANMSYVNGGLPPNTCVGEFATSNPVRYVFSFQGGDPTANAFVLQAVPQNVQATRDTLCATMRVNQAGLKTVTGTATNATDCL